MGDAAYHESLQMDRIREQSKRQAEEEAAAAEARMLADSQPLHKGRKKRRNRLPLN